MVFLSPPSSKLRGQHHSARAARTACSASAPCASGTCKQCTRDAARPSSSLNTSVAARHAIRTLRLLLEHGLCLTTVTLLLAHVTALTLRVLGRLAGLVLGHLVRAAQRQRHRAQSKRTCASGTASPCSMSCESSGRSPSGVSAPPRLANTHLVCRRSVMDRSAPRAVHRSHTSRDKLQFYRSRCASMPRAHTRLPASHAASRVRAAWGRFRIRRHIRASAYTFIRSSSWRRSKSTLW